MVLGLTASALVANELHAEAERESSGVFKSPELYIR